MPPKSSPIRSKTRSETKSKNCASSKWVLSPTWSQLGVRKISFLECLETTIKLFKFKPRLKKTQMYICVPNITRYCIPTRLTSQSTPGKPTYIRDCLQHQLHGSFTRQSAVPWCVGVRLYVYICVYPTWCSPVGGYTYI